MLRGGKAAEQQSAVQQRAISIQREQWKQATR